MLLIEVIEKLNEVGEFMESEEPVPDHWDAEKKLKFYAGLYRALTPKTRRMLRKLIN